MPHTSPRRERQTKIVATLGPTSTSYDEIKALFLAGADVFRLNFSHGKQEDHLARLKIIRQIEAELNRPIGILADLQGPKLRVGTFKDGSVTLTPGTTFRFDNDQTPGDNTRVYLPHADIMNALKPGAWILLDDGKVRMEVIAAGDGWLDCHIHAGTKLSDRKGFNIPNVALPISALTTKDRSDLAYALDIGVDWIALSFVQRPEDVAEAKRLIQGRAAVIIKLEKPQALDHLDRLIELADGLMVARGDLGVELPPQKVPSIQKSLIRAMREAGKPVIVATQMLESMITSASPTRAEVSDVANAVYDGTDAVMLSAETASGDYPIEAITIMDEIIKETERDGFYRNAVEASHPPLESTAADAITAAAHQVADTVNATAIVTYTTSGSTTLRAARERPSQPILCLTALEKTARRMVLSYGVHPVIAPDIENFDQMIERANSVAKSQNLGKSGQRLVVTAGVPFGTPGSTNVLRITWIP